MRGVIALSLGVISLIFGSVIAAPGASGNANYRVKVPAELDRLDVRACFRRGGPMRLRPASSRASSRLRTLSADSGVDVRRLGDEILIRSELSDACVDYRIDLASVSEQGHWRRSSVRTHDAILVTPAVFLWLPVDLSTIELRFELPPGYAVSAPWERFDRGDVAHYRIDTDETRSNGKIALGRFDRYHLAVEDATIDVAVLRGEPPAESGKIRRWLEANIDAVSAVHGRFPVPRLQLLVVPLGAGDEPVPWGQVTRGGGDAVHLYVDQRQSESVFLDDWVLSHELSHLFHPPMNGDARWIYEGLASYYQYVARARTGMLTPRQAWAGLHSGFERGRRGGRPGRSLNDATENMHREQAYMQVYWSGAAIFLLADLQLRRDSGGAQSLDRVLADFHACCLPSDRLWRGDEFLHELDRLSGTRVFSRLAETYGDSDRFPDLNEAYRQLGLTIERARRLGFGGNPAGVALRDAIMGPP